MSNSVGDKQEICLLFAKTDLIQSLYGRTMKLIKDSIIYDMGYVAGGTFQSVGRDIAKLTTHDFSSFYAARESSAKKSVEEFNKDYGGF